MYVTGANSILLGFLDNTSQYADIHIDHYSVAATQSASIWTIRDHE
jgi:hypothetical protein